MTVSPTVLAARLDQRITMVGPLDAGALVASLWCATHSSAWLQTGCALPSFSTQDPAPVIITTAMACPRTDTQPLVARSTILDVDASQAASDGPLMRAVVLLDTRALPPGRHYSLCWRASMSSPYGDAGVLLQFGEFRRR